MGRFWVGVASREHVLAAVRGGVCQLNHGKQAPVRRLHMGEGMVGGELIQAFHHYWAAAIWLGLGLVWFLREIRAARLDDLSSDTLALMPRRRALFSPERIFAQS
jgi:hypothetical protein